MEVRAPRGGEGGSAAVPWGAQREQRGAGDGLEVRFRSELCASHVRHRSRRIIAYYRSFNIIGGRGSITPMVHVRPLERRAPYIVTQDGPFDFAVSDYPRSSR